jgi:RNA 3'-terminal phosphate cyclase (ATP)
MLTIDGSFGEGGGQIIRSSLALALVTGRPFTIAKIRAGRKKPGLQRQHLTAVTAAARISGAEVEGAELGSACLVFVPGEVRPGDYRFSVGTAGSTTLVLQTILPALLIAKGESHVTLEGGTHNPLAPPFDFLAKTFLPLVNRLGPTVTATLERPGFHPAGGGCMTVHLSPAEQLGNLELLDRGPIASRRIRALVANLPRHIAERECRTAARKLAWDDSCCSVEEIKGSRGPGNVVLVEVASRHVTAVFAAFGQRGVKAEDVATQAAKAAQRYLEADVPVGEYLADQLQLPLGIAAHLGGGPSAYRTLRLSPHSTTHIELLGQFLGVVIDVEQCGGDECVVRIGSP